MEQYQIIYPNNHFSCEEVFQAYFDCRKGKRQTKEVKLFEEEQERNLMNLYYDLNNGSYQIGRSICFVVSTPKYREVWAGRFRDRIVHHLIYNRIFERFSKRFIYDSYACLPGRGTLFGIKRIDKFMRSASENYQKPIYFLQCDLKNFFVSINKTILNNTVLKRITEPYLGDLITQVIFHNPVNNPIFNSPKQDFSLIPYYKSLFNTDNNHGLPIGNLTSQFFANIYLNKLDQFVKRKLKVKYYGRYIDDIIMIHESIDFLNNCFKEMKNFIIEKLELEFHPNKTITNTIDKGINFCGQIIKPYRRYMRNRNVKNMKNNVFYVDEIKNREKWKSQINSYIGMLKWCNSYNLRNSLTSNVDLYFGSNCDNIKNFNLV